MSREIRRVPQNWDHPKNDKNQFVPMLNDYISYLESYKKDVDRFVEKMTEIIQKGRCKFNSYDFNDPYELYDYLTEDDQQTPPDIRDFMPTGNCYQLFETVSDGTPITPPFKEKQELVYWLTNNRDFWGNKWSEEGAKDIVESGFALSGIMKGGVMYGPEKQHLIK